MVKWFPWKWLVRRTVRSHGLIDPFTLLARLRKFAEPSEVDAPLELIRAWTVFQARGIVNTRAIQHNLDWVWPYWVERQFNPRDPAFVPRSFSLAHINLTHRNWAAVCVPDAGRYALVDPRGLVTPLHDGWSIDAWLVRGDGALAPSRCRDAEQTMLHDGVLAVETRVAEDGMRLVSRAEMHRAAEGGLRLEIAYRAESDPPAALCIALRPYNPEGVQFIDTVKPAREGAGWLVNRRTRVLLDREPARYAASVYKSGDVFNRLERTGTGRSVECPVGMATAVAVFPAHAGETNRVTVSVPIEDRANVFAAPEARRPRTSWAALDELTPVLDVPDPHMKYLFRTSVRTLLSLSAADVYPGSYTYRRFWFRDACLMLHALLTLNHRDCCRRAFETSFPHRQTVAGFFQSQQGEWDSNGQVLWLAGRYRELTGEPLPPRVLKSLRKGAEWLCRKRLPRRGPHPGLLPPGFSAEHLGPNNHYY